MNVRRQSAADKTAYQETVAGLLRLHVLTVKKEDETEEYHELCAALDGYSRFLTPVENERVGGLSEDLYTVSDPPGAALESMTPQSHEILVEFYEARKREDWDLALKQLRKLSGLLPPPLVAYLRGSLWEGLGEWEIAVVFYAHAHELARDNWPFLTAYLSALKRTDLPRALELARPILEGSDKYDGNLVVQAAEIIYWDLSDKSDPESLRSLHKLIDVLKGLLERAAQEPADERGPYPHMTLFLLATLHRQLGMAREAYDYYSRLITLEPQNDGLFVSRGILAYESNPLTGVVDFERAIELRSQIVWPYYYLAHYLLSQRRYEECWRMCQKGLTMPGPSRVHSALLEFLAIAMAGLGFPTEIVQRAFEDARQADPKNERAGENLRRFLDAIATSRAKSVEWEYPSSSSIRDWNTDRLFIPHSNKGFAVAEVDDD